MNVHLTPELERLIKDSVASGQYGSASEVIREAVRVWSADRQWHDELRRKIAEGYAQAKTGQLLDGTATLRELREELKNGG